MDEFSTEEAIGVVLKKFKKMKSIIGNEEIIIHVYDKLSMKNFGDFNLFVNKSVSDKLVKLLSDVGVSVKYDNSNTRKLLE